MKSTGKSQHVKAFIKSIPEDGTIDRHRSGALNALSWAEETESDAVNLHIQVDKIARGFTANTGIEIPPFVKPSKPPRPDPVKPDNPFGGVMKGSTAKPTGSKYTKKGTASK